MKAQLGALGRPTDRSDGQVETVKGKSHRRRRPWIVVVGESAAAVAPEVFVHSIGTHHYDIGGSRSSDSGRLTCGYTYGDCDMFREAVLVRETDDRVVAAATYMPGLPLGSCTLIRYEAVATSSLRTAGR